MIPAITLPTGLSTYSGDTVCLPHPATLKRMNSNIPAQTEATFTEVVQLIQTAKQQAL